ncbi:MAG TPA: SagB/ThcOx family dehydrogenase [Jatrophihabitans sp.]|jgi:SagB-type dehydrogenase family enzyme|nr:SagB/ThcOx family dehydrogenase [Jatrophihabitans sp.]
MRNLVDQHRDTLDGSPVPDGGYDADYLLRATGYSAGAVDLAALAVPEPLEDSLRAALARRRSQLRFTRSALPLPDLAAVLLTAFGHLDEGSGWSAAVAPGRRAYPSGGALYPIEVIVCPLRIEGLAPRPWYLQSMAEALVPFGPPARTDGLGSLFGNDGVADAAVIVLLWADFARPALAKYAGKEYRLMLLEAGHAMQNLALVATTLGLPVLPSCGFDDQALATAVGLHFPVQSVLYAAVIGGRSND